MNTILHTSTETPDDNERWSRTNSQRYNNEPQQHATKYRQPVVYFEDGQIQSNAGTTQNSYQVDESQYSRVNKPTAPITTDVVTEQNQNIEIILTIQKSRAEWVVLFTLFSHSVTH